MSNSKKLKNKTVKLFGLTIKIIYKDAVLGCDGDWVFGSCESIADTHIIEISLKDRNGDPISQDSLDRTLRHELFHSILIKGQYLNASNDEPLVEWLSLCTDELNKKGLKI